MTMKTKFLKSRRDKKYIGAADPADLTVNDASDVGPNRTAKSSAFGHSNFGRDISPDEGRGGMRKLSGGKSVNPVGGVGKGSGMGDPTRSGSNRSMPKTGDADDVISMKKKKGSAKFLKSRG